MKLFGSYEDQMATLDGRAEAVKYADRMTNVFWWVALSVYPGWFASATVDALLERTRVQEVFSFGWIVVGMIFLSPPIYYFLKTVILWRRWRRFEREGSESAVGQSYMRATYLHEASQSH